VEPESHRRRLLMAIFCWILVAVALSSLAVYRFSRRVDSVLRDTQRALLQRRSVPLKVRRIVPHVRTGYFLWPTAEKTIGLCWLRESLYAVSDQGLLQMDLSGHEVRRFGVLDGLPSNRLHSLVKTANALWMGTAPQGLLRFDGDQFDFYWADRVQDFEVTCLLPLDSGSLLVGTRQRGLLAYRDGVAQEFSLELNKTFITCLFGNDRQLAIGTHDEGLYLFRQGLLTRISTQPDSLGTLPDNLVSALAGNDQVLYAGTPLGISEIRDGRVGRHLEAGLNVRTLALDSQLLAGTDDGLVFVELKVTPRLARARLSRLAPEFPASPDRAGPGINGFLNVQNEWLAATDTGIFRFGSPNGTTWKPFGTLMDLPTRPGIPSKPHLVSSDPERSCSPLVDANIAALALDQEEHLWVGYFDRGLDIFDARGQRLRHYEDDRLFCVNHILLQPGGLGVVSTANGIVLVQGDQARHVVAEKEGLSAMSVAMTLPLGTSRQLLAATAEGISFLDNGQPVRNLNAFHGLASNHTYSAAQMGSRVFVGTLAGLSVLEGSQPVFSWNTANSQLLANWVNALAVCQGKLFVGTYGGGIQSVDSLGQWTDYSQRLGKFEVNPNAMFGAGDLLFAGTLDRGFYVYHAGQDEWRQVSEELPSLNVTSFALGRSFLLVGTDNGLVRIAKTEIMKLFQSS
jgi:ligand-binding sensor domain-containing protein